MSKHGLRIEMAEKISVKTSQSAEVLPVESIPGKVVGKGPGGGNVRYLLR
jgi:hypothetical protein